MSFVTSKDGTRISYLKQGGGQPVILVGGALQTKADGLFAKLASLLSAEFMALSYDRRGRGESGNTQPYSVDREVEDLLAIIDSCDRPVFLFGNSSGAQLALKTALVSPKVSKVVVYEAPYIPDQQLGSAVEYEKALRDSIAQGRDDQTLRFFFSRIGVPGFAQFIMKFMPMWKDLKKLAPTLLHDAILVGDGSVPQQLKSVGAKTLILSGDTQRMIEAGKRLAEVIPDSRFKVLQGQKHAVKPSVLYEELKTFLRK